jgi:hypothetical protein
MTQYSEPSDQRIEIHIEENIASRPLGRPYDSMFGIILTHQL